MGTILCYGDSNTWGFDSRSFIGDRMPDDVLWTNRLAKATGWHVENHGQNGRQIPITSTDMVWLRKLLDDAPAREAPVWLWIMLGTNDLLVHDTFTAEDVTARMRTCLTALQAHPHVQSGAVHLRLISPPPMKRGAWADQDRLVTESERLGPLERALAEELGIAFTEAGQAELPLLYDGVHLSEEGHRAFAELMKLCGNAEHKSRYFPGGSQVCTAVQ